MFSLLPLSVIANTQLILSTDQKFLIEYYDYEIVCHCWSLVLSQEESSAIFSVDLQYSAIVTCTSHQHSARLGWASNILNMSLVGHLPSVEQALVMCNVVILCTKCIEQVQVMSKVFCTKNIFCTKWIEQAEVMSKVDVGIMRPAQVTLAAAI